MPSARVVTSWKAVSFRRVQDLASYVRGSKIHGRRPISEEAERLSRAKGEAREGEIRGM